MPFIFEYYNTDDDDDAIADVDADVDNADANANIVCPRYEDKYLVEVRKMDREKPCGCNYSTSFTMEMTPNGNVLMLYNKEKDSFIYYSDNTIPYRYLEVVARKYVKVFQCKSIYIDMEEELALFEEKSKQKQETKKEEPVDQKKSVFAKFKSYNKDAGGKINPNPPPPRNNNRPTPVENEHAILKAHANHYIYNGKLSNFSFLQKPDKKRFNKKLALSFSDFKKLNT